MNHLQKTLQSQTWLEMPMWFFSLLGEPPVLILFLSFIVWSVHYKNGIRFFFYIDFVGAANTFLKNTFLQARPYYLDPSIKAYYAAPGLGMPSGHAQTAVVLWMAFAYAIKKNWMWLVTVIAIIGIGLSRIFLGVHTPMQVLAGWLFGMLTIWILWRLETPIVQWFLQQQLPTQLLSIFATGVGILLIGLLTIYLHGDWKIPELWLQNYTKAAGESRLGLHLLDANALFALSGFFQGHALGVLLVYYKGGYTAKGNKVQKIKRFIVGSLGMLPLLALAVPLLAYGDTHDSWGLRLLSLLVFILPGLWITGGAPLLFKKLGLT